MAGAAAEFGLAASEVAALRDGLLREGCAIDAELLDFYMPAYLAFQLGHSEMAVQDALLPAVRERLAALRERYACALRRHLALR